MEISYTCSCYEKRQNNQTSPYYMIFVRVNMFDIVYYIVPQIHMDICESADRDNWREIIVTDSENVYEYTDLVC